MEQANAKMAGPTFWDDQEAAQKVVAGLSNTQAVLKPLDELLGLKGDAEAYLELAKEDPDEAAAMADDLAQLVGTLEKRTDAMELHQVMADPVDRCDAFVQIQAGGGRHRRRRLGRDAAPHVPALGGDRGPQG